MRKNSYGDYNTVILGLTVNTWLTIMLSCRRLTTINIYLLFRESFLEKNPKNKKESIALLNKFRTLPITNYTADILSELKYKYDNKGISLPLADLLIAAQAIEHKACLITSDRHFERIEELQAIFI